MKFSIIIPLYNKAPYIRKALESVFAQTYTDYELIVVDDGSTDDSYAIADEFVREAMGNGLWAIDEETNRQSPIANRLKQLKQPNAGVSAARNNGVAQASGDYLAFLDADDWWEPTYLEKMAQLIEDYPEAGLYACNYVYYKPGKTRVAVNNIETGYFNYPKAYYEGGAMPIWTGAAMIPLNVFEEMGGFPLGIKLGEDFLLWSKIAMQYKVAFLNEALAWYNNDVPVALRATRNLHHPNNHMLFRMDIIVSSLSPLASNLKIDWQALLDKLRVNGLLEYWMSKEYHDVAVQELRKVDWTKQPNSIKRIYSTPICILKVKKLMMTWGSWCKQRIYRLKVRGSYKMKS